jgi:hypothetical protein
MATTSTVTGAGLIRKFSGDKLQSDIDAALKQLPDGKMGAVVASANLERGQLAVMARMGNHWSAVGVIERPWVDKKWSAEAKVQFAW